MPAIVNKRRRNQSVDELKTLLKSYLPNQEEPTTLRIAAYKPGPGSELRKMLAWFARPSDTCKCETRAETMMQAIVAPIEIHQEAAFNDLLRRYLDRLRWARVHRLGTYVQTGGWQ